MTNYLLYHIKRLWDIEKPLKVEKHIPFPFSWTTKFISPIDVIFTIFLISSSLIFLFFQLDRAKHWIIIHLCFTGGIILYRLISIPIINRRIFQMIPDIAWCGMIAIIYKDAGNFLAPLYTIEEFDYHDKIIQNIDSFIGLGSQPSQILSQILPGKILGEFFHFHYFSFCPAYSTLTILIRLTKGRTACYDFACSFLFSYLSCFVIWFLYPVRGPYENWGPPKPASEFGWFFPQLCQSIVSSGHSSGTAFPSTHCAIALCIFLGARKWMNQYPIVSKMFQILSIGIIISTVYCGFHYLTDSIVGCTVSYMVFPFGTKFCELWMSNFQSEITEEEETPLLTSDEIPV